MGSSFKVEVRRADKRFPLTSYQIACRARGPHPARRAGPSRGRARARVGARRGDPRGRVPLRSRVRGPGRASGRLLGEGRAAPVGRHRLARGGLDDGQAGSRARGRLLPHPAVHVGRCPGEGDQPRAHPRGLGAADPAARRAPDGLRGENPRARAGRGDHAADAGGHDAGRGPARAPARCRVPRDGGKPGPGRQPDAREHGVHGLADRPARVPAALRHGQGRDRRPRAPDRHVRDLHAALSTTAACCSRPCIPSSGPTWPAWRRRGTGWTPTGSSPTRWKGSRRSGCEGAAGARGQVVGAFSVFGLPESADFDAVASAGFSPPPSFDFSLSLPLLPVRTEPFRLSVE